MTLRLTESELAAIQARQASFSKRLADASWERHQATKEKPKRQKSAAQRLKVRSPEPRANSKNSWEQAFAALLEARKQAGEIVWYAYEPFRIRLANGCFYRPDYACVDKDGRTEIYEVKGHMREAARLRLRIAVEKLPYPFFLVRKVKGEIRVTKV